ncbi:cytidine deaminase [Kushneria marisflavi]|uniref:Cytidine deaminase n=1 Tax=Kushneria marisflavi TaxID=157779 RepID=A0A240UPA7_9GAMM|nr:cytidine deaminase [Kushneria marisflavi]ART63324.1 cytidine deaminase [Kushneria marisflavi]RKD84363.1 cytidine deaminase [Kushneria marisflavi]
MTDLVPLPESLRQQLIGVRDNAYAPYSNHPVGALLISNSGTVYTGCNVESANYKGLCAEAGAIAAMVAHGEREIKSIHVIGPGDALCTPCGDCRQRIREFAAPDTEIVVVNAEGLPLKRYDMETLLPDSFGPENLGQPSKMA